MDVKKIHVQIPFLVETATLGLVGKIISVLYSLVSAQLTASIPPSARQV
jgi:cell division protein FtsX